MRNVKRIFIDTNVMLDFLAQREPYFSNAETLFALACSKKIRLIASSLSFITSHYVLDRQGMDEAHVRQLLQKACAMCKVVKIDHATIVGAINSPFKDMEDGLQHLCALSAKADMIITRNEKDFTKSQLPVMSPAEFIPFIKNRSAS